MCDHGVSELEPAGLKRKLPLRLESVWLRALIQTELEVSLQPTKSGASKSKLRNTPTVLKHQFMNF